MSSEYQAVTVNNGKVRKGRKVTVARLLLCSRTVACSTLFNPPIATFRIGFTDEKTEAHKGKNNLPKR